MIFGYIKEDNLVLEQDMKKIRCSFLDGYWLEQFEVFVVKLTGNQIGIAGNLKHK